MGMAPQRPARWRPARAFTRPARPCAVLLLSTAPQLAHHSSYQKKHRRTARAPPRLCSAASSRRILLARTAWHSLPSPATLRCSATKNSRAALHAAAARRRGQVATADSTLVPARPTPPRPQCPPRSNPTPRSCTVLLQREHGHNHACPLWAPGHTTAHSAQPQRAP